MSDEDMEDYGFEYSDEEQEEEFVDVENQYYSAKGLLESNDIRGAIDAFSEVLSMEQTQGEWGFKTLKQLVKLYCRQGQFDRMMEAYGQILSYAESGAVTRNAAEKKLNSLMDFVASQLQPSKVSTVGSSANIAGIITSNNNGNFNSNMISMDNCNTATLRRFYETTLAALSGSESGSGSSRSRNERLILKARLRLCELCLHLREFTQMRRDISELHKMCQLPDGSEDPRKGTQLLDTLALEIQLHTEAQDAAALRRLYRQALGVKSAIPHPRILGVVRECGGKMHLADRQWAEAATDFFEAFKAFDEAGSARRVSCLKYLVIATLLGGGGVDPLDAREARPFRDDPGVAAAAALAAALRRGDVRKFEEIIRSSEHSIMSDPHLRSHLEQLVRQARAQLLKTLLGPYSRVSFAFLQERLNVAPAELEPLLVGCVLDGTIKGRIDQINQILELETSAASTATAPSLTAAGSGGEPPAIEPLDRHRRRRDRYITMRQWAGMLGWIPESKDESLPAPTPCRPQATDEELLSTVD